MSILGMPAAGRVFLREILALRELSGGVCARGELRVGGWRKESEGGGRGRRI